MLTERHEGLVCMYPIRQKEPIETLWKCIVQEHILREQHIHCPEATFIHVDINDKKG